MGTQKLQTSPYQPQTNGQCERFNSTLIGMLGMLPPGKKSGWKNHIGALVHAYNCTWNSATGFSPYYPMYGSQPCLPVDVTREEIRLEERHWDISPCLQLYLEFSYRVQFLLPHVWEASLPPCRCYLRIGITLSYGTFHFKVHTENVRMCLMGP